MIERIDLSTVPSAMETLALSWAVSRPLEPKLQAQALPTRKAPTLALKAPPVANNGRREGRIAEEGERAAQRDAMRALARDIPKPAAYARRMPRDEAIEVLNAEWAGNAWRYRYEIDPRLLAWLRSIGLAYTDKGDRTLTSFACAVRRILMDDL